MQRTLQQLAEWLGLEFRGESSLLIEGVAALETAEANQLTFLANSKYKQQLLSTRAGVVMLAPEISYARACLISRNPYADFTKVMGLFAPVIPLPEPGIHPLAVVHPEAHLGQGVAVGPFCVVGAKVRLGDRVTLTSHVFIGDETVVGAHCIFYPQVVVRERVRIGQRVIVHPGTVIGADGFGFAPQGNSYAKIPQIGTVLIEDDVEIGANVTIDRAALGETKIGQGCKIDNLVQIAHNVVVGPHSVIAAQTGISGSSKIGQHVMIGGQVGISGHLKIGSQSILGAQAGITRDVPDHQFVSGYPARPHAESMRQLAALTRLPELLRKIQRLEERIQALEGK